jgi:hypothetical protein
MRAKRMLTISAALAALALAQPAHAADIFGTSGPDELHGTNA